MEKKPFFFHNFFLCLYNVYDHQIWRELWRKNWYLLLLKCLEPKSWSQKVRLTAVISALTPPVMKNLSLHFSGWIRPFWSSLYFFMKKNIFFPQFFFMSLLCLLSPNLARTLKKKLISASFKIFYLYNFHGGKKISEKSYGNGVDNPPVWKIP